MSDTHDAISAFLDNEPFDASELLAALSDPAGRELLIDLVALRHLTQTEGKDASRASHRPSQRSVLRGLVAAAAVVVALVGGYVAGERRSTTTSSEAPAPTRIVETSSAWQTVIPGRTR
jgi:hypothetical protein